MTATQLMRVVVVTPDEHAALIAACQRCAVEAGDGARWDELIDTLQAAPTRRRRAPAPDAPPTAPAAEPAPPGPPGPPGLTEAPAVVDHQAPSTSTPPPDLPGPRPPTAPDPITREFGQSARNRRAPWNVRAASTAAGAASIWAILAGSWALAIVAGVLLAWLTYRCWAEVRPPPARRPPPVDDRDTGRRLQPRAQPRTGGA